MFSDLYGHWVDFVVKSLEQDLVHAENKRIHPGEVEQASPDKALHKNERRDKMPNFAKFPKL